MKNKSTSKPATGWQTFTFSNPRQWPSLVEVRAETSQQAWDYMVQRDHNRGAGWVQVPTVVAS